MQWNVVKKMTYKFCLGVGKLTVVKFDSSVVGNSFLEQIKYILFEISQIKNCLYYVAKYVLHCSNCLWIFQWKTRNSKISVTSQFAVTPRHGRLRGSFHAEHDDAIHDMRYSIV